MNGTDEKKVLIDLLTEAAGLEHCLLDAYLYTAASLRSTPQEFASLPDGQVNRRRALHFEQARLWKQMILEVSREEMLHLHYVQTLLRSIGARPCFTLPERDPVTHAWVFRDWKAKIGDRPADGGEGVQVPVSGATLENLRRFVLYESTDALQDMDPYGPEARQLFSDLADLELSLRIETMLLHETDELTRAKRRDQLMALYRDLLPADAVPAKDAADLLAATAPETFAFQSIADFYNEQILPRFREAFDQGWVRTTDRQLVNELQDPEYAAEGFLPVNDVYRDKNFEASSSANITSPLLHFKRAEDIIKEIVEEGEGAIDFATSAQKLLETVRIRGARAYVEALYADQYSADQSAPTPDWLAAGQLLRGSHLYKFSFVLTGMERERELAAKAGTTFDPVRPAIAVAGRPDLDRLIRELPLQFNACYVVLTSWLSRMYEIEDWLADKPRRLSIEMLASWPLMSMAIRPMLELATFLPVDRSGMFRLEADWLPPGADVPVRRLLELWLAPTRSETIRAEMDRCALATLTEVAAWAQDWRPVVAAAGDLGPSPQAMMTARLEELSHLREFEKEFPYREAGGYSDRQPDLTYTQLHPEGFRYAESVTLDPTSEESPPLFDATLLLRLRFRGWGQVQLATDPDPTFDEVGVTGTHMLHAADGDRRLDRALAWKLQNPATTIQRGPEGAVPPLGVDLVEATLCVAAGAAPAGYVPIGVMNSKGAVQASGVQQVVCLSGVEELVDVDSGQPLTLSLEVKDGQVPFLNGLNHVVSQDGEAIDPFVLRISGTDGATIVQREVFSEGTTFLEMTPLQRLASTRRPSFDRTGNTPDWARMAVPEPLRDAFGKPGFADQWLSARAHALQGELGGVLEAQSGRWTATTVDEAVSLAERLTRINLPRKTTVGWLGALLHYGHTVSGPAVAAATNPLLERVRVLTGLPLQVTGGDRMTSNGRWLAEYSLGAMDTDSLRYMTYGQVHLPVQITGPVPKVTLTRSWQFRADMEITVSAVACHFDHPFWGDYQVGPDRRSVTLADGQRITDERVDPQTPRGYRWRTSGISGLQEMLAELEISSDPDPTLQRLTLTVRFLATTSPAVVAASGIFGWIAGAIAGSFTQEVGLREVT